MLFFQNPLRDSEISFKNGQINDSYTEPSTPQKKRSTTKEATLAQRTLKLPHHPTNKQLFPSPFL
jgi:hypothetical protein